MNKSTGIVIGVVVLLVVVGGIYAGMYNNNDAMMAKEKMEQLAMENTKMAEEKAMMEKKAMEEKEAMMKDNSMMKKDIVVSMKAQNASGQTGTATLSDMKGKTKVVISIPAGTAGVAQPAHIHIGACPNPGSIAYPLTSVVDGKSETVLDTSLETLYGKLPLAINVHKSKDEAKIYFSCGDLSKAEMSTVMTNKGEVAMMEKGDTMMKTGSYEAYAPEKVALASATHDVVLFFRASWCPTCRAVDADIKANLGKIPSTLAILDVNYDNSASLKQKYGVTYQHTFVQIDKDGNLIKKWSGSPTLSAIALEVK